MSAGKKVRLVLFDVGGVLVELSGLPQLLAWLGNRLTTDQVITLWLNFPSVRSFEAGKIPPEAFAEQLIAEMALPVSKDEYLESFRGWIVKVLPGAAELVRRVPRKYVRATLCNTNVVHWPRLGNHRELIGAFDHHFPSHLTGKIKPDAEAFRHVLETLRCKPADTLFLDDSRLNIEAANSLGIQAFQVKGPAEAERVLRQAGVITDTSN